jgi:hypothetical protein
MMNNVIHKPDYIQKIKRFGFLPWPLPVFQDGEVHSRSVLSAGLQPGKYTSDKNYRKYFTLFFETLSFAVILYRLWQSIQFPVAIASPAAHHTVPTGKQDNTLIISPFSDVFL